MQFATGGAVPQRSASFVWQYVERRLDSLGGCWYSSCLSVGHPEQKDMNIAFIRGAYLNNFEGQSYHFDAYPAIHITGYSSLYPLDAQVPFSVVKLPSIADIQSISFLNKSIKYIANRTLGDSQILMGLERHLRNADIVHIADPHYYYAYQAAQLKKSGARYKLISTWWETIPHNNETTHAKKQLKREVMSQVDGYVCYTSKAKECLLAEGVSPHKIQLIPLGVNLTRFTSIKKKEQDKVTILFVGRLVEEKGVIDLYKVFRQLAQKNTQLKLRIVGQGPLGATLAHMRKTDSLQDRVSIVQVPYLMMPYEYQQADMLVAPSKTTQTWEEQLGMVLLEAMASGLPIVGYHSGAVGDIVGNAGLIVPEGDTAHLLQSIRRLATDKQERDKLGTMGKVRAKKLYDARKTAQHLYAYYRSHLSKK